MKAAAALVIKLHFDVLPDHHPDMAGLHAARGRYPDRLTQLVLAGSLVGWTGLRVNGH